VRGKKLHGGGYPSKQCDTLCRNLFWLLQGFLWLWRPDASVTTKQQPLSHRRNWRLLRLPVRALLPAAPPRSPMMEACVNIRPRLTIRSRGRLGVGWLNSMKVKRSSLGCDTLRSALEDESAIRRHPLCAMDARACPRYVRDIKSERSKKSIYRSRLVASALLEVSLRRESLAYEGCRCDAIRSAGEGRPGLFAAER